MVDVIHPVIVIVCEADRVRWIGDRGSVKDSLTIEVKHTRRSGKSPGASIRIDLAHGSP
jgi:hypothetical protein